MSASCLATVELRLCMHFCGIKSLLALARCSRFTLAAASDRFAWKFAAPFADECGGYLSLPTKDFAARVSSSLIRFGIISLTWMDCGGSEIDVAQVAALPLAQLNLKSVLLRPVRFDWLSDALLHHGTGRLLKHLGLNCIPVGQRCVGSLVGLLTVCSCLTSLDLSACDISVDDEETLAPALALHPTLIKLNLGYNPLETGGLMILLPIIQQRLEVVLLNNCSLTDEDFTKLLHTLMHSDHMKLCDVRDNYDLHMERHQSSIAELQKVRPNVVLLV
jgi:hypothetical protein